MDYSFFKQIKNKFNQSPKLLLLVFFFLCFIGLFLLSVLSKMHQRSWGADQLTYFSICIFIGFIITLLDIRIIYRYTYLFCFFCVLLLVLVYFKGKYAMGAKRWIEINSLRFQPAEIAKVGLLLFLAKYFSKHEFSRWGIIRYDINVEKIRRFTLLSLPVLCIGPILLLIASNPDLGTSMIFFFTSLFMFFIVGYPISYFVFLLGFLLCLCPVLWTFLKEYQKKRLLVFFVPEYDPKGAGYNLLQSKIAIGSGGFFGKGLMQGTQSHLKFLPEYQTDFIFAYFAEEFGFLGCIFLLSIYLIFIVLLYSTAEKIENRFQKFFILGFATLVFVHCFVNIAMVMGLLPIVGVPLPFLSYGGSMQATLIFCFALCINFYFNRRIKL